MTSHDKERIHRWITQADLERMLDDAYAKGAEAMRDAASINCATQVCSQQIKHLPAPKRPA
jgi:hypothetical protein